jgi:hypothetical protein
MIDRKTEMTSYLVFERKDVTFQVPDDFPEDQIPKFLTHREFLIWYKSQNFTNLEYINDYDDNEKHVIAFYENNFKAELKSNDPEVYKLRISSVKWFFRNMKQDRHLLKGWFNEQMFSLNPIDFLKDLSEVNLPITAYQTLKNKLIKKYPTKSLQQILKPLINNRLLDDASEQFLEMLFEEKIDLQGVHFFSLHFTKFGKIVEYDSMDEFSNAPFSLRKMELLLKMCNLKYTKSTLPELINQLNKLIETKQMDKFKLLLASKVLDKTMAKEILKTGDKLTLQLKSLLLSIFKEEL